MRLSSKQFSSYHNQKFLLASFGQLASQNAMSKASLSLSRLDEDTVDALAQITPEELRDAMLFTAASRHAARSGLSRPPLPTQLQGSAAFRFISNVRSSYSAMWGSAQEKARIRQQMLAYVKHFGAGALFITISPSDLDTIDVVYRAVNVEDFDGLHAASRATTPSSATRRAAVNSNAFACATFFDDSINLFVREVLGWNPSGPGRPGIFGNVAAFIGCTECQGKGTLHLHLILWLEGLPRTTDEFESLITERHLSSQPTPISASISPSFAPMFRFVRGCNDGSAGASPVFGLVPNPDGDGFVVGAVSDPRASAHTAAPAAASARSAMASTATSDRPPSPLDLLGEDERAQDQGNPAAPHQHTSFATIEAILREAAVSTDAARSFINFVQTALTTSRPVWACAWLSRIPIPCLSSHCSADLVQTLVPIIIPASAYERAPFGSPPTPTAMCSACSTRLPVSEANAHAYSAVVAHANDNGINIPPNLASPDSLITVEPRACVSVEFSSTVALAIESASRFVASSVFVPTDTGLASEAESRRARIIEMLNSSLPHADPNTDPPVPAPLHVFLISCLYYEQLVSAVQTHKAQHTPSCVKASSSNSHDPKRCRYGYPRSSVGGSRLVPTKLGNLVLQVAKGELRASDVRARAAAIVNENNTESTTLSSHILQLGQGLRSQFTNPYSFVMLYLFRTNHDIRPLISGGSFSVTVYVAKYASKTEKEEVVCGVILRSFMAKREQLRLEQQRNPADPSATDAYRIAARQTMAAGHALVKNNQIPATMAGLFILRSSLVYSSHKTVFVYIPSHLRHVQDALSVFVAGTLGLPLPADAIPASIPSESSDSHATEDEANPLSSTLSSLETSALISISNPASSSSTTTSTRSTRSGSTNNTPRARVSAVSSVDDYFHRPQRLRDVCLYNFWASFCRVSISEGSIVADVVSSFLDQVDDDDLSASSSWPFPGPTDVLWSLAPGKYAHRVYILPPNHPNVATHVVRRRKRFHVPIVLGPTLPSLSSCNPTDSSTAAHADANCNLVLYASIVATLFLPASSMDDMAANSRTLVSPAVFSMPSFPPSTTSSTTPAAHPSSASPPAAPVAPPPESSSTGTSSTALTQHDILTRIHNHVRDLSSSDLASDNARGNGVSALFYLAHQHDYDLGRVRDKGLQSVRAAFQDAYINDAVPSTTRASSSDSESAPSLAQDLHDFEVDMVIQRMASSRSRNGFVLGVPPPPVGDLSGVASLLRLALPAMMVPPSGLPSSVQPPSHPPTASNVMVGLTFSLAASSYSLLLESDDTVSGPVAWAPSMGPHHSASSPLSRPPTSLFHPCRNVLGQRELSTVFRRCDSAALPASNILIGASAVINNTSTSSPSSFPCSSSVANELLRMYPDKPDLVAEIHGTLGAFQDGLDAAHAVALARLDVTTYIKFSRVLGVLSSSSQTHSLPPPACSPVPSVRASVSSGNGAREDEVLVNDLGLFPSPAKLLTSASFNAKQAHAVENLANIFLCLLARRLLANLNIPVHDLPAEMQTALTRSSLDTNTPQFLGVLLGAGGCGKSFVLSKLEAFAEAWDCSGGIALSATSGIAATLINGVTAHRMLGLDRKKRIPTLKEDSPATILLSRAVIIVVDEFSMMGPRFLSKADRRLRGTPTAGTFDSNLPFGGASILLCGDLAQLAPCKDLPLYVNRTNSGDAAVTHGLNLYPLFESVFVLDENMRANQDPEFVRHMDLLRNNSFVDRNAVSQTSAYLSENLLFQSTSRSASRDPRGDPPTPPTVSHEVCSALSARLARAAADRGRYAPLFSTVIVRLNHRRAQINQAMSFLWARVLTSSLTPAPGLGLPPPRPHPVVIQPDLTFSGGERAGTQENLKVIARTKPAGRWSEYNEPTLVLSLGMPVMLLSNICVAAKAANGSKGIVVGILTSASTTWSEVTLEEAATGQPPLVGLVPDPLPATILVDVPTFRYVAPGQDQPSRCPGVPDSYPITTVPVCSENSNLEIIVPRRNNHDLLYKAKMEQFPITPAFATTVHKVQGATLDVAVVTDVDASLSHLYVAASRVRSKDSLYFSSPVDIYAINHATDSDDRKKKATKREKRKRDQALRNEIARLNSIAANTFQETAR